MSILQKLFGRENQQDRAQALILKALEQGKTITSNEANRIGHTVDSRSAISRLRKKGYDIRDTWITSKETGKRFKAYWLR